MTAIDIEEIGQEVFASLSDEEFETWLVQESQPWRIADALAERFPESEHPVSDAHSGLYAKLERYERDIYRDHGVRLSVSTMRQARATAIAWPRDTRVSRASFKVHAQIRGEDRAKEMAKRLKQAERENRALSAEMLVRLRADERGTMNTKTDRDRLRSRLASAVKTVLAEGIIKSSLPDPDWWNGKSITADRRALAVEELRRLADLINGEEVNDDN